MKIYKMGATPGEVTIINGRRYTCTAPDVIEIIVTNPLISPPIEILNPSGGGTELPIGSIVGLPQNIPTPNGWIDEGSLLKSADYPSLVPIFGESDTTISYHYPIPFLLTDNTSPVLHATGAGWEVPTLWKAFDGTTTTTFETPMTAQWTQWNFNLDGTWTELARQYLAQGNSITYEAILSVTNASAQASASVSPVHMVSSFITSQMSASIPVAPGEIRDDIVVSSVARVADWALGAYDGSEPFVLCIQCAAETQTVIKEINVFGAPFKRGEMYISLPQRFAPAWNTGNGGQQVTSTKINDDIKYIMFING